MLPRSNKTEPRKVTCPWCNKSVTALWFLRHARSDCPLFPGERPGERLCSTCKKILAIDSFGSASQKKDGIATECKECGLSKFHEWRRKLAAGEVSRSGKKRPGKWVLKPCQYCGTEYSFNARVAHEPRCHMKPTRHGGVLLDKVVPENTAVTKKELQLESGPKASVLRFNFGMSLEQWNAMNRTQAGLCAICKDPIRSSSGRGSLHVDHCHVTGKIRGLLCHYCNIGIGHFEEKPELLDAAKNYLAAHNP